MFEIIRIVSNGESLVKSNKDVEADGDRIDEVGPWRRSEAHDAYQSLSPVGWDSRMKHETRSLCRLQGGFSCTVETKSDGSDVPGLWSMVITG